MAVELREKDGPSGRIIVFVEDDGNWFEKMEFSAYWLGELIDLLLAVEQRAAEGKKGGPRC